MICMDPTLTGCIPLEGLASGMTMFLKAEFPDKDTLVSVYRDYFRAGFVSGCARPRLPGGRLPMVFRISLSNGWPDSET